MTRTLAPTTTPRYRQLFAPVGPDQPLGFFLIENLLTARTESMFPTNGAGPDEDVNIYLAHLLGRFLAGEHDSRVGFAGQPLLNPPAKGLSRRQRADYYRVNADHRLLCQGLFGWGDLQRRRNRLYRLSAAESRFRDLAGGKACYEAAASHLRGRTPTERALMSIWTKLAANYEDYVHVLGALATRQLGLGAHLDDQDLGRLLPPVPADDARAVATLLAAPPPPEALDSLLDLWLDQQKNPAPATASRLREMADRLGVDLGQGPASVVAEPDNLVE